MDLTKLIDLSYLFNRFPPGGFSWPFRVFLLFLFFYCIILAVKAGKNIKITSGNFKKLWYKVQLWGWTTGFIGLLLFFFREVRAIYLSSRIWMFIWILVTIIWGLSIIKYLKKELPKKEEIKEKQEAFNKWLPKQKK